MTALRVVGLSKSYGGVRALKEVSFSVAYGETVGVIGNNGSGKTTLFDVIGGYLAPDSGFAEVAGRVTAGLRAHRVARLGVARLFQEVRLARAMPVSENIAFALGSRGFGRRGASEAVCRLVLKPVGLEATWSTRVGSLSYGQQKLLSLAMCLAAAPRLMLLDEPFAGIAGPMVEKVIDILESLRRQGTAVVVIDHNIDALRRSAARLLALSAGRVIAEGPTSEVLNSAALFDACFHLVRNGHNRD